MRCAALVLAFAFCSSADAAAILTTQDNYTTPVLPVVETFDDGKVNAPGLSVFPDHQIIAGGLGGLAIEPTKVWSLLDGKTNETVLSFVFAEPWPTQVGFVTTQAEFAGVVGIGVFPDVAADLSAQFEPNRYFQVTDPNGIQAINLRMQTSVPGEPFFQIDDLQYVPEPSGSVLLAIGVAALLRKSNSTEFQRARAP